MKFKVLMLLCLLAAGCRTEFHSRRSSIDLTERLSYAQKSDNLQVILFGRPESKKFLLAGWSNPEKDGNETFQWAASNKTAFYFNTAKIEPLFLHIKLGSFFPNTAQVLLNRKPFGTIQINGQPEVYSLRLPAEAMKSQTNVVEFDWNELREFSGQNESQKFAAAAYFAVITPAKYVIGSPKTNEDPTSGAGLLDIAGKKRKSLNFPLGGTVRFYERLSKNSRFEFGIFFDPPAISEDDDFAEFSITLRQDGKTDQRIFQKKIVHDTMSREKISLSKFVTFDQPQIYEIEFKIQRNSILDTGKAAWIEPILSDKILDQNKESKAIDQIRSANKQANVIVIILDAAAAKHFPTYGYHRKTTPNIEKLAQEGVQFDKAYCQAVYTLASTATMMSGLDPYRHQVIYRRSKLPAQTFTLAERFLNGGYATGTFVANGNASSTFGMTQGFQEVREVFRETNYSGWGSDITNRFTQWLDRLDSNRPFFAYIHYREPHAPFNPPESFKNQFTDPNYSGYKDASYEMRRKINMGEISATQADRDYIIATYDENLKYGDYEVGRVIRKLKDREMYDRTVVIVTADHGEAFWEHKFQGHNSQLYEESVQIPLIVKFSKPTGIRGKKVKTPVRTVDVYPTLVDLIQLSSRNWNVDGRSFLADVISEKPSDVPVFSQSIAEQAFSYTEEGFKYIYYRHTGAEELYNLKIDPQERNNLIKNDLIQAGYLRSRLFGWHAENKKSGSRIRTDRAIVDESTLENLKTLGYIDE